MSGKSDTAKLMGFTVDIGSKKNQYDWGKSKLGKDWSQTKYSDIIKAKSDGRDNCYGWSTSRGSPNAKIPEGSVYLSGDSGWKGRCASWKKAFRARRYRHKRDIMKPNSEHTMLYNKGGKIAMGQPCPYAEKAKYTTSRDAYKFENDPIKLSCDYPKIDDSLLRKMSSKMQDGEKQGPRYIIWQEAASKYCEIPGNAYKKIKGDTTCKQQFKDKNLAVKYCETGGNIAKDQKNCTVENLTPSVYDKIAKTFCKANASNKWCGCYNIINRVCDSDPNAAGCLTWVQKKAILKSSGQDVSVYDSKPQCAAPVCTGSEVFTPATGDSMTCNQKYNICTQNIKQGVAKNSPTNASCNLSHSEQKEADKNGASDPSKVGAMAKKEESLTDQLATLAQLDSMDKEDAAAGDGAAAKKKSGGSNTLILVIVAFVMLCMCGGLVLAMK